ncbi:MAG: DUF882 domain-containing protein [Alphaproteobacteria bacterium]|nr:DUF882 domain-containing protein [Alphaproteobacteria bacterium]NCQ88181.1 DUF882 domain-containing protein [Alphaproteobacteria bacterium]NCT05312.1 DUF882 domain-containing protein [Alphaproteobacteria bacterium]
MPKGIDRRSFLSIGAATLGGLLIPGLVNPAMAVPLPQRKGGARRISFRNAHTGESFAGVYRVGDKYLPDAFDQINHVLRDHRADKEYPMDPRVLDIIYQVHKLTGRNQPLDILSGYRCPSTNRKLRQASGGVAKKSLHMKGQAIDFHMEDYSTARLRDIAESLRAGGVGYYSRSDFVHVDSGDFRTWGS